LRSVAYPYTVTAAEAIGIYRASSRRLTRDDIPAGSQASQK